ncbi:fibronectin type III domain-containing protein [Paenibacillus campi]|uniref:fibronectin type III domain-containing protein n=1 Tax=Paenibacillus campi TaxID=3106031 RepID=UPI002AFF59A4|nr:fibronectin type III domain-containing protein [Paenibacillus sp. SGZ-1014]
MHNYMKQIVLPMLILVLAFSFAVPSTYAASVGQQLLQPESNWVRIDDSFSEIKRDSTFKFISLPNEAYNNGYYGSTAKDATISFVFTGTKIRLIAPTATFQSKSIAVTIDGKSAGTYAAYSDTRTMQVIVFEKTDLANAKHTIQLKNNDEGRELEIDAVDLAQGNSIVNATTPFISSTVAGNQQAILKVDQATPGASYTVYYGTDATNYTNTVNVQADTYGNLTVPNLTNGTTYFFAVTTTTNGSQSAKSNQVSVTLTKSETTPTPVDSDSNNRAILVITMMTGLEKEYDLPMSDVNQFISWYDNQDAGKGSARFEIKKYNHNIGPFSKRTDSVIFKNILYFEVNEYKPQT